MAGNKQYESATVFNARIVIMNHLWVPSDTYKGKKQEKPSWFAGFIVQKTQAQWHLEPALAGIAGACGKIYQQSPHIVTWPIADGDMPNPETGKQSEWAKGHWMFTASTNTNPPNVELLQNNALIKLQSKVGVKSGDYCMVGVTAAVKQNDVRAVKLFLNAVVFSAPGEEIAVGNSVSGAELMAQAQAQGLRPAGFSGSPGGFGVQPGGAAPFGSPPMGGGFPGNSYAPQGGGFAPTPGNPASAPFASPPNGGGGPGFASPSNGSPFGGQPQNPFAPR